MTWLIPGRVPERPLGAAPARTLHRPSPSTPASRPELRRAGRGPAPVAVDNARGRAWCPVPSPRPGDAPPRPAPARPRVRACAALAASAALLLTLSPLPVAAADRMTPDEEGQALAAEVRAQQPEGSLTTAGVLRLRDAFGKWADPRPVRMEVATSGTTWQTRYLALDTNQAPVETLIVSRSKQGATRYDYTRASQGRDSAPDTVTLTGNAAAVPFAGSEFWLSDLGLEFLHWPQQRVLKHEMRKGRSCKVLESLNPDPVPANYARVLSWIDIEHRGILRAEAYDPDRRLVKEFSIGSFKKVDGRWQLKSMEIRNEQTDARTRLEFDLEFEDR